MLKKSYYIFSLLFLLQFPCIANDNSTTTKITVKKNYHTYTFLDENENVMDIVKIEDSDSEEVEDIWINFTTGTLETYSPTYYIQNGYLLQNEVKEDGY